jgi:hypothetical protein
MRKPKGGGLAGILNLALVAITAAAIYFGIIVSPSGHGKDIRDALVRIGEHIIGSVRSTPSLSRTGAASETAVSADEGTQDNPLYASLAENNRREALEGHRIAGLLSQFEKSVRENRREETERIAREMESIAQRYPDDGRYLYMTQAAAQIQVLQEEIDRLVGERDFYRNDVQDALQKQLSAESALALQESNAQIQEILLQTAREQYVQSQEELSYVKALLDSGETLATIEAKERVRQGYREGIDEARVLLEESLRIRNRNGRIAFLTETRTRYPSDSAMAALIATLLERL